MNHAFKIILMKEKPVRSKEFAPVKRRRRSLTARINHDQKHSCLTFYCKDEQAARDIAARAVPEFVVTSVQPWAEAEFIFPYGDAFVAALESTVFANHAVFFKAYVKEQGIYLKNSRLEKTVLPSSAINQFFRERTTIHGRGAHTGMTLLQPNQIEDLIRLDLDLDIYIDGDRCYAEAASGDPADNMRLRLML